LDGHTRSSRDVALWDTAVGGYDSRGRQSALLALLGARCAKSPGPGRRSAPLV